MTNTLGVYNPIFFAQEALIQLEKALGMASRVHRGYDEERRQFEKGQTIQIRRPSTFTAQDAPSSAQDLNTETVEINLANWKEVKFKLSDKEYAYTGQRIIDDHIRPAAYAMADAIDQSLVQQGRKVGHLLAAAGNPVVASDLTKVRRRMQENAVPMDPSMMHFMVDPTTEEDLLNLAAFVQHQGAGEAGVQTQRTGFIGQKYGYEFFVNQNVEDITPGAVTAGTPLINQNVSPTGYPIGTTTINLDAVTLTGTLKVGDVLQFASHSQKYAVTTDVTASGNAFTGVGIYPPLKAAVADNSAVTVTQIGSAFTRNNIAFHRNAFAIAMAPLPDLKNFGGLGAAVASIQDPKTSLALRSRIYYVGNSSEIHVAIDALWGVQTLDPNLAVRLASNPS